MSSKIIQDISRYQPAVDFRYLKSIGQNYIIMKAGSGNGTIDRRFEEHYAGARTAGMTVIPYFWVDPIYDPTKQAQFFLTIISNREIGFIVVDFEQWWGDWQKWAEMNAGLIPKSSVPLISPDRMLNHFKSFYYYLKNHTDKEIVVYTAAWFLNSYCRQAYTYLADKYTHWADYSLFNTQKVYTNWNYLETIVPVGRRIPSLPLNYPTNKVLMWQFSGDKFSAQGVWGDIYKKRLSPLDLNYWINPTISIEQFCNVTPVPPEPEPEPDPVPDPSGVETWEVWTTYGVKIRQYPTADSTQLGTLLYKEQFKISANENGWGKLYGRDGYTSLYYSKKISESTTPPPVTSATKWKVTATAGLNIREAATTASNVIGGLTYGTIVEITSIANGWGKLWGRQGYISMAYLVKV